jgi:hypothetical protein
MNIDFKNWVKNRVEKMKDEIREYINSGIDKNIAVEMVLKDSTVGAGYKAQIRRYEFKQTI